MKTLVLFAMLMFGLAGLANSTNLYPDQAMYQGQSLSSDDGRYTLIFQGDGNLVYYRTSDWAVRWDSKTQGQGGNIVIMQSDGNLVMYNGNWAAVWNAGTQNHPGAFVSAQNDGNLPIYWNGQALWHIGADTPQVPDPRTMGDAVGRAMESNMPYSSLGHVGFIDHAGKY